MVDVAAVCHRQSTLEETHSTPLPRPGTGPRSRGGRGGGKLRRPDSLTGSFWRETTEASATLWPPHKLPVCSSLLALHASGALTTELLAAAGASCVHSRPPLAHSKRYCAVCVRARSVSGSGLPTRWWSLCVSGTCSMSVPGDKKRCVLALLATREECVPSVRVGVGWTLTKRRVTQPPCVSLSFRLAALNRARYVLHSLHGLPSSKRS